MQYPLMQYYTRLVSAPSRVNRVILYYCNDVIAAHPLLQLRSLLTLTERPWLLLLYFSFWFFFLKSHQRTSVLAVYSVMDKLVVSWLIQAILCVARPITVTRPLPKLGFLTAELTREGISALLPQEIQFSAAII